MIDWQRGMCPQGEPCSDDEAEKILAMTDEEVPCRARGENPVEAADNLRSLLIGAVRRHTPALFLEEFLELCKLHGVVPVYDNRTTVIQSMFGPCTGEFRLEFARDISMELTLQGTTAVFTLKHEHEHDG